ncbi:MAG TPA: lysophospholipid acyltransferase family protein, partial [Acidimicrobiales bacterium]|nr:lysophospholipid acyltransferase family protein [Acidimicrobiales bacterium]
RISYVGKAEYLDDWKTKHLFPALGMIPIHRGGGSSSQRALDTAAEVLQRGELFGIYPEGTRSRTGKLHRGHTGPARLALRTGAPIIPVGLRGTDHLQPTGAPLPRPFRSCQVNIGPPIDVSRYRDRADDRLVLRQLIDEVMFEIRKLSGQEYVDVYANKRADAEGAAPAEVAEPAAAPEVDQPEPAPRPVEDGNGHRHERVLVGAAGAEVAEDAEVIEERRSSADVLARWWS